MALTSSARKRSTAATTSSSSSACTTSPCEPIRSRTSRLSARSTRWRGLRQCRSNDSGRTMRWIRSTSRKPCVVMSPMRGPRRSMSMLVPTVVPCTKYSMAAGSISAFASASKMPCDGDAGVVSDFATCNLASPSVAIRSVNVPPISTATLCGTQALQFRLLAGQIQTMTGASIAPPACRSCGRRRARVTGTRQPRRCTANPENSQAAGGSEPPAILPRVCPRQGGRAGVGSVTGCWEVAPKLTRAARADRCRCKARRRGDSRSRRCWPPASPAPAPRCSRA